MVKSKKYNKNLKKKNYKTKVNKNKNKNKNKTKKKKIRSKSLMNKKNRILLGGGRYREPRFKKVYILTSIKGWNIYINYHDNVLVFEKKNREDDIEFSIPNTLMLTFSKEETSVLDKDDDLQNGISRIFRRVNTTDEDTRFFFLMQYIFNMEFTGLSSQIRTLIDEKAELRNIVLFIAFTVYFPNNYTSFKLLYKAFKGLSFRRQERSDRQTLAKTENTALSPEAERVMERLGFVNNSDTDTTIAHKIYRAMDFSDTTSLAQIIVVIIEHGWCPENIFTSFILLCINKFWDLDFNKLYRAIYDFKFEPLETVSDEDVENEPLETVSDEDVENEITAYLKGYINKCPVSGNRFSKSRFNWDLLFQFDEEILSIKCVQVLLMNIAEMNLTSSDTTHPVLLKYKECMKQVLKEISRNTLFRFVIYFVTNNFYAICSVFKILGISDKGIDFEERLYELVQFYIKSRQLPQKLTIHAFFLNTLLPGSQFKGVFEPQTFIDLDNALNVSINTYC